MKLDLNLNLTCNRKVSIRCSLASCAVYVRGVICVENLLCSWYLPNYLSRYIIRKKNLTTILNENNWAKILLKIFFLFFFVN